MNSLPLILAHGFNSLGDVLVMMLLALLLPCTLGLGAFLCPIIILQAPMFRERGLPPLPHKTRSAMLCRLAAGLILNLLCFAFWVLFTGLYGMLAFLGAEAVALGLRWLWCKKQL